MDVKLERGERERVEEGVNGREDGRKELDVKGGGEKGRKGKDKESTLIVVGGGN